MLPKAFIFVILINILVTTAEINLRNMTTDTSPEDYLAMFKEQLLSFGITNIVDNNINTTTADLLMHNFGLNNEDKYRNATQLIAAYGYFSEEYEVVTSDGYVLTMFRVLADPLIKPRKPPVLLFHGLLNSADDFLTSGRDDALPFVLVNASYDVWMGNARGNKYSKKHISLSPDDKEFWDFSWHEIGIYDLPTMIDFVLDKTNRTKILNVGHSQATTAFYVMSSEMPDYNKKISCHVSLAPIAFMSHLISPVVRGVAPFVTIVNFLLKTIGAYEFAPADGFLSLVTNVVCGTSIAAVTICNSFLSPIYGFDIAQVNFKQYPVQVSHVPAGAATKQLVHYGQEVNSGKFRQYDYGEIRNQVIYGSPMPPSYNISNISAKIVLMFSCNDWLSNYTDVRMLAARLPNVTLRKVPFPFNHMDYVWGKDAKQLIYLPILELFEELGDESNT